MKIKAILAALATFILAFSALLAAPAQANEVYTHQLIATYGNDEVIVNYNVAWDSAERGNVTGTVKYNCGGDGSNWFGVVYVEPDVNLAADRATFEKSACNVKKSFSFTFDPSGSYDVDGIEVRAVVGNATSCSAGVSGCPTSTVILTSKASASRNHDNPLS